MYAWVVNQNIINRVITYLVSTGSVKPHALPASRCHSQSGDKSVVPAAKSAIPLYSIVDWRPVRHLVLKACMALAKRNWES